MAWPPNELDPTAPGGAVATEAGSLPRDAAFDKPLRQVAGPTSKVAGPIPDNGEFAVGTVLDEQLRIERVLGRGGMGVVYLAHHLQLGREVALKLTQGRSGEVALQRTLREARAMASLTHENVVTVYDVGTVDDRVFIAMEYVDGGTARTWAREADRHWRQTVDLYVRAGRGLAAAHEAGLVHRDFKPDNVLVGNDGRVRVADFGLARAAQAAGEVDEQAASGGTAKSEPKSGALPASTRPGRSGSTADGRLTATGATVGTPAYMAPEQYDGRTTDARSDQFAFCVSVFESLHGNRPFTGTTIAELFAAVAGGEIKEPEGTGVPAHVRRALQRGLSVNPSDRFPAMDPLLRELSRDPGATLRRRAVTLLMLGVTAVGTWYLAQTDEDVCAGGEAAARIVWSGSDRDRIGAAFVATGQRHATEAWDHTHGLLDAYANEWVAAHRQACEATRVHDTQSAELMDLRMACLESRRGALAALLEVFGEPDADVVHNAPTAAAALPTLDRCADANALRAIGKFAPEQQSSAAAIDTLVTRSSAYLSAGKSTEARTLAEQALADARALGTPALIARAERSVTHAHQRFSDFKLAREHALAGLGAAITARDDEIATVLTTNLLCLEGYYLRMPGHEHWAALASAWVERVGSPPNSRATMLSCLGLIAREEAHYVQAAQHFEQLLQIGVEAGLPDSVRGRGMLADTYRRMGDLAAANALYNENLQVAELALGPNHPVMGQELNNAAGVLAAMGRFPEALAQFERALQIRVDAFGEHNDATAETLVNMLSVLSQQARPKEALEVGRRALEALRDSSNSPQRVTVHARLAAIELRLDRTAAALDRFREANGLAVAELPRGHIVRTETQYNYAWAEEKHGQVAVALALADDTLEQMREVQSEDHLVAGLLHALRGDCRARQGEHAGALVEFVRALELLEGEQNREEAHRFEPLVGAAEALVKLDRSKEALEYLDKALVESKSEAGARLTAAQQCELHLGFAVARLDTGDREGARASARQAETLAPKDRKDLRDRARTLVAATR